MDAEGAWRDPADWPGDLPPIENWVRGDDGRWTEPPKTAVSIDAVVFASGTENAESEDTPQRASVSYARRRPEAETTASGATRGKESSIPRRGHSEARSNSNGSPKKRSRQAEADVRAMLLVGGAIGVCILLLGAAFALQSRADAVEEAAVAPEVAPEVVFAAETEEVRQAQREEAAAAAPEIARTQLVALPIVEPVAEDEVRSTIDIFDETQWVVPATSCLDPFEEVLIERSSTAATFADNFECVPDGGQWIDNYLGITISRTIDAEVRPLIPPEVVHASGGSEWTPATRSAYLADVSEPATMVILSRDSGHNPRNSGPEQWRPSNEGTWCGYAVDWVTVKTRWELSVSAAEAAALDEMLNTCADPGSSGAHLDSVVIDAIEPPTIARTDNG